ncbi:MULTISPECIES: hypothetical protein [Xanthomonas]|uniref:hypothetical protein n=1 Tax=Xanthomonas TaxID=338 RepID=UPI00129052E4|nr:MULTISPECIES: hypothetical protein [Xanthomonas]
MRARSGRLASEIIVDAEQIGRANKAAEDVSKNIAEAAKNFKDIKKDIEISGGVAIPFVLPKSQEATKLFSRLDGVNISRLTNKEVGEMGGKIPSKMLADSEFTDVFPIQNASGNGFYLIARAPNGELAYFEVKTSAVGSVKGRSPRQANVEEFLDDDLSQAASGSGRYKNLSAADQIKAITVQHEFEAVTESGARLRGTAIGIDLKSRLVLVSLW